MRKRVPTLVFVMGTLEFLSLLKMTKIKTLLLEYCQQRLSASRASLSCTQEFTTTHHGSDALLISHFSLTTILQRWKNHAHRLGRKQDQQKFAMVKLITLNFARMDPLLIMVFPVIRILTSTSLLTSDHLVRMCSSTLKNYVRPHPASLCSIIL